MKFGTCCNRSRNKMTCWPRSSATCAKNAGEQRVSTTHGFAKLLTCAALQFHWISCELPLPRRAWMCLAHLGTSGLVCFNDTKREKDTVWFLQSISKRLTDLANGLEPSVNRETVCRLNAGSGWKRWGLSGIRSQLTGRK